MTIDPYDFPINQPDDDVIFDPPLDILCSYHYFKDANMATLKSWGTRIIGDSGAFSAMSLGEPIDRDEFHAWAKKWQHHLYWIAGLDVIGDAKGTFQNWMAAKREGLDLVPTLHYGEPPETMNQYIDQGATFLGLGGMVPYKSEPKRLMRWCLSMHRYARDHHPDVRFHGWGTTHSLLVDGLPWWSVDSSGFASAFRFGTMKLFDPTRGSTRSIPLDGRAIAKHSRLLKKYYNTDWRDIATSNAENRRKVGRVAIKSQQLHAAWLQRRRKVTPPPRFQPTEDNGPLVSIADTTFSFITPPEPQHGPMLAAATAVNESWNALNPTGKLHVPKISDEQQHGPLISSPMAYPGTAQNMAVEPPQQTGPLISAAMGAPSMQPLKSLDPNDPLAKKPKDD